MATLLLTTVGTLFGGPLGGALGALAGQQIDQAVIGGKTRQGPRLKELNVQSSSCGTPLPRHYGRMRISGTVIWATDLKENREKQGGGKGRPKTVSYSYTSSFAVALASRPIRDIGRIWADGNLLRGAAGDLKVGGTLRIYHGHADQNVDPLVAQHEAGAGCPAFRGTAYLVFEDLELAEFGNRIPSLSCEIIADDGEVRLVDVIADIMPGAVVRGLFDSLAGFSIDNGNVADACSIIADLVPLTIAGQGETTVIAECSHYDDQPVLLPPPVLDHDEERQQGKTGFARKRERLPRARQGAIRYYDIDRDFQPGVQHGRSRSQPGDAVVTELPAAMEASRALAFADVLSRRIAQPRETATVRIAELSDAIAPGRLARVEGGGETWLIESWEWSAAGVELSLRALPFRPGLSPTPADPGRASNAPDLAAGATRLAAFELPWDGNGAGELPALFAAPSSASATWRGAALYAEHPDGSLVSLGPTGRTRATVGTANGPLPGGSSTIVDRQSVLEVDLASTDFTLADASLAQLAMGANRALVGNELLQFGKAEKIGPSRWRLQVLLRGRGGTEAAIAHHQPDENFVLIDESLLTLDSAAVGESANATIVALGLGDAVPVAAPFALAGSTLRPLSPVHGATFSAGGSTSLRWTRRARGAWLWRDAVETPLAEERAAYVVGFGEPAAPIMLWETEVPFLSLPSEVSDELLAQNPDEQFFVRQRGDHALSDPHMLGRPGQA